MATFTYTKIADFILDDLFGFASSNAIKDNTRYIAEDILGDPASNSDASAFPAKVTVNTGGLDVGDGTNPTETLTVNADTGDAEIILQVNNSAANAWKFFNDNSDSDRLKVAFNGVTEMELRPGGDLLITNGIATDGNGDIIAWKRLTGTTEVLN